jgi:hypothetical protein
MARYNTISATSSVAGGNTITTPSSGLLTTLTGSGIVIVPNPVLYTGQSQTFYNSTGSAITLSTNNNGNFVAPGFTSAGTISLPAGSIITVVSDGANYQTQGWLGGTVSTSNLIASGGSIDNINIGVTTQGTGKFSTLQATSTTTLVGMTATTGAFSGISTFTNSASVTLGSTSTGALQVTVGGASIAGGLYVSGASSFGNNVGIGQNNPQYGLDISGTLRYQAVSAGANTVVWGTGRNSDYHYHNYYTYPGTSDGYTLFGHYAYSSLVAANTGVGSYQFAKEGSGTDNKVYFNIATHNGTSLAERLRVTSAGNVGIGSTPLVSLDLSSKTDAVALPKGSSGQRPTGAVGYLRYNNSIGSGIIEYWNSSNSWLTLSIAADGSTAAQAGFSAQTIKNLTGTTTSGYYYITLGGTARQVWCDMSSGTAWMLAMRCANNTNTFRYAASYWTDNSTLNETSDPLTNTDIKNNYLWQNFTASSIRITGSQTATSYNSNPLVFTGFSATLNTIFNQGNQIYDSNIAVGRSGWMTWFTAVTGTASSVFDNQPNCNVDQINANYTYAGARIGIALNNENDCSSDDAAVGFGTYGNSNSGDGTGCGGSSWNPGNQYRGHGWLWIN